jgi:hypothetical protein
MDRVLVATSTLTCPACGHAGTETMPTHACVYFHACKGCGALLKPLQGDGCVFCSYGDTPCPPVQAGDCAACGAQAGARPCAWSHRRRAARVLATCRAGFRLV